MTVFIGYEKIDSEIKDLEYAYEGDCCFDLRSSIDIVIPPFNPLPTKVPTGVKFEIPRGYELQVRPRSGSAAKFGITVLNSPGTIDAQYRGEVIVLLVNTAHDNFHIKKNDRIAQAKIAFVPQVQLKKVDQVKDTDRGSNGFGSTGVK